jgi:hypothetical protein
MIGLFLSAPQNTCSGLLPQNTCSGEESVSGFGNMQQLVPGFGNRQQTVLGFRNSQQSVPGLGVPGFRNTQQLVPALRNKQQSVHGLPTGVPGSVVAATLFLSTLSCPVGKVISMSLLWAKMLVLCNLSLQCL